MKITLEEARVMADTSRERIVQGLLKRSYDSIRSSASVGDFCVHVIYDFRGFDPGPIVGTILASEGYEIEGIVNGGSCSLKISWTKPEKSESMFEAGKHKAEIKKAAKREMEDEWE